MNEHLTRILLDDLNLPADRLTGDTSLDHAGLDSLAVVELSVLLAERYGIDVSCREIEHAATLSDLNQLITARRRSRTRSER
ncbi:MULTISPECIES: acyl carrier protein [unclassified Streptomyces]|uniref:acyl carrier protein n=1 Tax=unclassified Streptomyces TaxID=2593676 RepID=UPI0033B45C1E